MTELIMTKEIIDRTGDTFYKLTKGIRNAVSKVTVGITWFEVIVDEVWSNNGPPIMESVQIVKNSTDTDGSIKCSLLFFNICNLFTSHVRSNISVLISWYSATNNNVTRPSNKQRKAYKLLLLFSVFPRELKSSIVVM